MTNWFWSDVHLNHANIIGFCNRPFDSVFEMNRWIVETWQSHVDPHDNIWFGGDFGFSNRAGEDLGVIFDRLPGHKHLVKGNHDEENPKVLKLPWDSIHDLVTVKDDHRRIVVCHYPLETWKNAQRGWLHVHGHSHGTLRHLMPHRYDIGMDALGKSGPVSFDALWQRGLEEEFTPVDHHGDAADAARNYA